MSIERSLMTLVNRINRWGRKMRSWGNRERNWVKSWM